jgi:hypothetical protein
MQLERNNKATKLHINVILAVIPIEPAHKKPISKPFIPTLNPEPNPANAQKIPRLAKPPHINLPLYPPFPRPTHNPSSQLKFKNQDQQVYNCGLGLHVESLEGGLGGGWEHV